MTAWALWDRLIPVLAVLSAGGVGVSLGRAWERIDWITGAKTSCGHQPECTDVRGNR